MTDTLVRIMGSVPDYYGTSQVYIGMQTAKVDEFDRLAAQQQDLRLQLHPSTATWGLRYFEEGLDIPTIETDSNEIRRSRVISKRRSPGNFSARLIQSVCESFINGQVEVSIDFNAYLVTVTFIGAQGVPPNLADLKAAVEDVVHAHLGVAFVIQALWFDMLESGHLDFNAMDAYTWDLLEKAAF